MVVLVCSFCVSVRLCCVLVVVLDFGVVCFVFVCICDIVVCGVCECVCLRVCMAFV